jgi:lysophospholipase L1-like esterase
MFITDNIRSVLLCFVSNLTHRVLTDRSMQTRRHLFEKDGIHLNAEGASALAKRICMQVSMIPR